MATTAKMAKELKTPKYRIRHIVEHLEALDVALVLKDPRDLDLQPRGRHVLGHVHRDELPPVVHRQGVAEHLGDDGRPPRPRLDDLFVGPAIHQFDLLEKVRVDERAFLE